MSRPLLMFVLAGCAMAAAVVLTACDDDDVTSRTCREEPHRCPGLAGAWCDSDRDCEVGFCCDERENSNCGEGMCTYRCDDDRDCPQGMLCEHDLCFYACDSDRDCARDQSCEHGNTICEY